MHQGFAQKFRTLTRFPGGNQRQSMDRKVCAARSAPKKQRHVPCHEILVLTLRYMCISKNKCSTSNINLGVLIVPDRTKPTTTIHDWVTPTPRTRKVKRTSTTMLALGSVGSAPHHPSQTIKLLLKASVETRSFQVPSKIHVLK